MPLTFAAAYQAPFDLRRRRSIDIQRLAPYPLLLLHPSFVLRKTFDAACRLARVRPVVQFECSSPHTLLSLAEAGHGVAIVPSNLSFHRYTPEDAADNIPGQGAPRTSLDLLGQTALAAALCAGLL